MRSGSSTCLLLDAPEPRRRPDGEPCIGFTFLLVVLHPSTAQDTSADEFYVGPAFAASSAMMWRMSSQEHEAMTCLASDGTTLAWNVTTAEHDW